MKSEMKATPKKIMAMVLAGGEGLCLRPLTLVHATPALPFGGGFRIVDFVLSNLVNSGIDSIYLLAQYKPQSLIKHIEANWNLSSNGKERFVQVVLPQEGGSFRGTADAVYQSLGLIERHAPDMVAVFAADQIYRMDVRQMAQFHDECGADVTVAATQVPVEQASSFGVIAPGQNGEILDFQEKPGAALAIRSRPGHVYASMGNYLFNAGVLVEVLEQALRQGETDFGAHILPRLIYSHHVHAYDFSNNTVPGTLPHEEQAYWRDVGTLDAYESAQHDVIGSIPRFNLHNPQWPMLPALLDPLFEAVSARPQHRMHPNAAPLLYPRSPIWSTEFGVRPAGR